MASCEAGVFGTGVYTHAIMYGRRGCFGGIPFGEDIPTAEALRDYIGHHSLVVAGTASRVKVRTTVVPSGAYKVSVFASESKTHLPKPWARAAFSASPTVLSVLLVGTA